MKSYGLTMDGDFFVESLTTLPSWTEAYVGRFIYADDTDTYWLGGLTRWVQLGYGKDIVDEYSINFGFGYRQVNSQSIPFQHDFISGDTIFEALISIASGNGLYDKCLFTRHFKSNQILAEHINWGSGNSSVNASFIPVKSYFIDSTVPDIIDVESAINQLELNTVKVSRQIIQSTAWIYSPADKTYQATVVALPITSFPVIIQCFDVATNTLISPIKIQVDKITNRIDIWYSSPVALNVVMVG